MKKIIFMALAFSLFACSSPENKPFVVDYTDRIIGEYPNFGSNEIAKKRFRILFRFSGNRISANLRKP